MNRRQPYPPILPHPSKSGELLPPMVRTRTDWVTVLVNGSWHECYQHWIAQSPHGVNLNATFINQMVKMFTPAAVGLATTALRQHLDAYRTFYASAQVTLFAEPLLDLAEEAVCIFGLLSPIQRALGCIDSSMPPFLEQVNTLACQVDECREGDEPFPTSIYAPGDGFFSAVDGATGISNATLRQIETYPERYALVDIQVTTLYGPVMRLRKDGTDMTLVA